MDGAVFGAEMVQFLVQKWCSFWCRNGAVFGAEMVQFLQNWNGGILECWNWAVPGTGWSAEKSFEP